MLISSLSSGFRQKRVQKIVLVSILLLSLYLLYRPLVKVYEKETIVSSDSPDMSLPIDNQKLIDTPLKDRLVTNNISLREMLSEELDYSLDQVEYFKKHARTEKVNGVFLALVRNKELDQMVHTIKEIERSFNSKYQYPYLFLNDVPFSKEFISAISKLTTAKVEFGLIPKEHWSVPEWISTAKLRLRLTIMNLMGIPYGGLESYRHMCRFNSGFFYKHPLIQKYDYYWRIEPDVDYPCNILYDPFAFMKFSKKKYGFNIVAKEFLKTVVGLWEATKSMNYTGKFLDLFGDKEYNGIHFWSNFEIGDLNWFRSKEYNDYFELLDKKGGFFYERWGDAPVHSLATGLLLDPSELHYFIDIGYRHMDRLTCPVGGGVGSKKYKLDCSCDLDTDNDLRRWVYRDDWTDWVTEYFRYFQRHPRIVN